MRKVFLSAILLMSMSSYSQSIQKKITNSCGASFSNNSVRLRISVGEPIIGNTMNSMNALCQGFFASASKTNPVTGSNVAYAVFPNPVSGQLSIKGDLSFIKQVQILNTLGQIVFTKNSFISTIDVSQIPNGVYICKIIGKEGQRLASLKIIKK